MSIYSYGKISRLDGPAIEWVNGDKSYYWNDKLVKIEFASGYVVEFDYADGLNGEKYIFNDGTKRFLIRSDVSGELVSELYYYNKFNKYEKH
jgi:hypothetical protein